MTTKEIQQQLKTLRDQGRLPASFKLNQKKEVLMALLDKLSKPMVAGVWTIEEIGRGKDKQYWVCKDNWERGRFRSLEDAQAALDEAVRP